MKVDIINKAKQSKCARQRPREPHPGWRGTVGDRRQPQKDPRVGKDTTITTWTLP